MSAFTRAELEYLQSHQWGRLATVSRRGKPQVKAVGFRYNAELDTIDIGGFEMEQSQKFRNVAANPNVSFLVDDVLPDGSPGFIEIRGYAQALASGGQRIDPVLSPALIRISPRRILAWDRSGRFPPSFRTVERARGEREISNPQREMDELGMRKKTAEQTYHDPTSS